MIGLYCANQTRSQLKCCRGSTAFLTFSVSNFRKVLNSFNSDIIRLIKESVQLQRTGRNYRLIQTSIINSQQGIRTSLQRLQECKNMQSAGSCSRSHVHWRSSLLLLTLLWMMKLRTVFILCLFLPTRTHWASGEKSFLRPQSNPERL